MHYFVLISVLLSIKSTHSVSQSDIKYFENLIISNTLKTENYTYPTYNYEFILKNGGEPPKALGYFDFVIVGGGLAGSVLAGRLSEREDFSVLLLEAGGKEDEYLDIPAMAKLVEKTKYNWGFRTVPQKIVCRDHPNFRCDYPRGKVFGGSTGINGLFNVRGNWRDYDKWAELGNTGWSYENDLPYFKKYENVTGVLDIDPSYHGYNGPITIENYKTPSPITNTFIEAMGLFGYPVTDYNAKNLLGIGYIQSTERHGRRLTAARAYVFPHKDRKNLKFKGDSYVTRLVLDSNGKKVLGVEFIHKRRRYVVSARKEVIVSAGSIQTPQILMLSGIGPKEELDRVHIRVKKDLPVGKNLKDQFFVVDAVNVTTNLTEEERSIREDVIKYLQGYGRLTINAVNVEGVGFIAHKKYPVTEIVVVPTSAIYTVENGKVKITGGKTVVAHAGGVLLHAKSTGQITLQSDDPLDFPLIDPKYFAEEDDLNALIETLDFLVDVYESKPMKQYNAVVVRETTYCNDHKFRSYNYWKCVIQYYGTTIYHPTGTCQMGPNPETSVVNDNLFVHGFKNLRVIDASVIPSQISGHLMPAVYMIAEKAADIIKKCHK